VKAPPAHGRCVRVAILHAENRDVSLSVGVCDLAEHPPFAHAGVIGEELVNVRPFHLSDERVCPDLREPPGQKRISSAGVPCVALGVPLEHAVCQDLPPLLPVARFPSFHVLLVLLLVPRVDKGILLEV